MNRYLTELIGTFFFVLTIGLTVLNGTTFAPIASGSALMVMVYMGGHISGGHYNPAVTLAVYLRRKLDAKDVMPYMIAQTLGGLLAAFAVRMILGWTFAPAPSPTASRAAALLVEFLFTFALALVVLNVATAKETARNSFYGLAIGFTFVVGAVAGGHTSGGAFNPAVGIGPTLVHATMGGGSFAHLWLYLVGPLAGGALAAVVFRMQHEGTKSE